MSDWWSPDLVVGDVVDDVVIDDDRDRTGTAARCTFVVRFANDAACRSCREDTCVEEDDTPWQHTAVAAAAVEVAAMVATFWRRIVLEKTNIFYCKNK